MIGTPTPSLLTAPHSPRLAINPRVDQGVVGVIIWVLIGLRSVCNLILRNAVSEEFYERAQAAWMVRDRGKMKGGRRATLLVRLLLAAPAFLILLCFAFTLSLSRFEPRGTGFSVRDPVIPVVGKAGQSPVQALLGALRSASSAASAYKNGSFTDHDAQVCFDRSLNDLKLVASRGLGFASS